METKHILFLLPIILFVAMHMSTTEIFAQRGSINNIPTIQADYSVSIVPGAAFRDSTYHYYPPKIAIPIGITVAWFNLDYGHPHTVTSGQPGDPDRGSIFNSGVMPTFPVRSFSLTFPQAGEYPYSCVIHPWIVASVSVSDAKFTGESFDVGLGAGPIWNITEHPRTLLQFTPKTVQLDRYTPITYNVTINDGANNQSIFSGLFTTRGEPLPLELVSGVNETSSYGPDFSSSGVYHIQSDFKKDSSYRISVEIIAIDGGTVTNHIRDTLNLSTNH
jgi:plastocyanin